MGMTCMNTFVKTSNESVSSQEVSLCVDGSIIIKKYLNNSGKSVCTGSSDIIKHTVGPCQHSSKCWVP